MLPPDVGRQLRRLQLRARRAVANLLGGEYHSVFKGPGLAFADVLRLPTRRRRSGHRLECHRSHGAAVPETIRRRAGADSPVCRGRDPASPSAAAGNPSGRSLPSLPPCSPLPHCTTMTGSACSIAPIGSSTSSRPGRGPGMPNGFYETSCSFNRPAAAPASAPPSMH